MMKKSIILGFWMIFAMCMSVMAVPTDITYTGSLTFYVGETGTVTFSAENATLYLATGLPSGATVSFGGVLSWKPTSIVTSKTITVTAFANDGNYSEDFDLRASNPSLALETSSAIVLGNEDQIRSNPEHEDDDEKVKEASATLTLKNSGQGTLSVSVSDVAMPVDSSYNLSYDTAWPVSLAPGASKSIVVKALVPKTLDAVDADLAPLQKLFGKLTFTGTHSTGSVSNTTELKMQAKNMLDLEKVYVIVNGESDKVDTDEDGDKVEDIKPGSDVEVQVFVENLFDDEEGVDLEDTEVKVEIDDSDWDVSEDEELGDISTEESDDLTLTFSVDEEADDKAYDMYITVTSTDSNGAKHGKKLKVIMDVTREPYELRIESMSLTPNSIRTCEDRRTVELRMKVRNIGEKDSKKSGFEIVSDELGISQKVEDISLDRDDITTQIFKITLPSTIKAGTYRIDGKTYYSNDYLSTEESVDLIVTGCGETTPTVPTTPTAPTTPVNDDDDDEDDRSTTSRDEERVVVNIPSTPSTPALQTGTIAALPATSLDTTEDSFTDSAGYIVLLVLASLLIIGVGVWLVLTYMK